MMRRSTQGEIVETSIFSAPLKISWATICCVQVVPDFAQVATTTSSLRNLKSFQTVESMWWLCISRLFTGHAIGVIRFIAALELDASAPNECVPQSPFFVSRASLDAAKSDRRHTETA